MSNSELDRLTKAVSQLSADFQTLSRQYLKDAKQLQKRLDKLEKLLKKDTLSGHISYMQEIGRKLEDEDFRRPILNCYHEYEAWLGTMWKNDTLTDGGNILYMQQLGRRLENEDFRKANPELLDEYEAWLETVADE